MLGDYQRSDLPIVLTPPTGDPPQLNEYYEKASTFRLIGGDDATLLSLYELVVDTLNADADVIITSMKDDDGGGWALSGQAYRISDIGSSNFHVYFYAAQNPTATNKELIVEFLKRSGNPVAFCNAYQNVCLKLTPAAIPMDSNHPLPLHRHCEPGELPGLDNLPDELPDLDTLPVIEQSYSALMVEGGSYESHRDSCGIILRVTQTEPDQLIKDGCFKYLFGIIGSYQDHCHGWLSKDSNQETALLISLGMEVPVTACRSLGRLLYHIENTEAPDLCISPTQLSRALVILSRMIWSRRVEFVVPALRVFNWLFHYILKHCHKLDLVSLFMLIFALGHIPSSMLFVS